MKFLFDLFPVILFFVAFKLADIYVATGVAIAATFAQVGWLRLRRRRVDPMLWASLAIIVVFGGATLLLRDETFIKWKPTVLYWLFALVLGGSMLLLRKNLLRALLKSQVVLPDAVWTRLNWSWTGFFAFMGAANLYVAYSFSTDFWVNFKLFGGMGLMLAFVIAQAFFLSKHIEQGGGGNMSVEAEIRARLASLEPERLELIDESAQHEGHAGWRPGGDTHWRLRIVSPQFAGKPTVARHRMVYAALGELMQHPIHALAIQARAPGEPEA